VVFIPISKGENMKAENMEEKLARLTAIIEDLYK
jgi:hypothetical protein